LLASDPALPRTRCVPRPPDGERQPRMFWAGAVQES